MKNYTTPTATKILPTILQPLTRQDVRYTHTHLHELSVDLRRERRVRLELRSYNGQVNGIHVRDKHHGVRVAHAHARDLPVLAIRLRRICAI